MKTCKECGTTETTQWHGNVCRECCLKYSREYYRKNKDAIKIANAERFQRDRKKFQFRHIRTRAKQKGLDFNLDPEDIVYPELCPLLGIKLEFATGNKPAAHSPSIDRIDPSKGYVKGNVWVISHKANTIKHNATLDELEKLVNNLKNCHPSSTGYDG